jgi:hypothetical protein
MGDSAKGSRTRMKKTDLLWVLAYPLYQLIGTFRHEGAHALFAWLEGAHIQEFVFWPSIHDTRGFRWGYVMWEGDTTWLSTAAPYFMDLLTFLLFFWVCMRTHFKHRWLWVNAIAIGLLSPFINSAYNYWAGLDSLNDVGKLLRDLPPLSVHLYFIVTLAGYLVGMVVVIRGSAMAIKGKK